MKEYKCKSCSAPLTPIGDGYYKCEYCGSIYKLDKSAPNELVVIHNSNVQSFYAKNAIDLEYARKLKNLGLFDDLRKRLYHELAYKFEEAIMNNMEVIIFEDPYEHSLVYGATLRLVSPLESQKYKEELSYLK